MAATTLQRRPPRGKTRTPPAFTPMMATLIDGPFNHGDWIFEPKFDGLRVHVRFDGKRVSLISRNDKPQEGFFPDVEAALRGALKKPMVADGEIVCFDEDGRATFRAIQQRFHLTNAADVRERMGRFPAAIYLFDLLWRDGRDLTNEPLLERKRFLKKAVRWSDRVRETEFTPEEGKALFAEACQRGDEGIIGKLAASRYVGRRDPAWVKIKCVGRQEFVIGGFTDPQRSRVGLGALLVGYYDGDDLVYAGKVGTGYTYETLLELREKLRRLEFQDSPFDRGDTPRGRDVHWVVPDLVAEIAFAEWTVNGLLRQPRFEGLRTDKKPRDCRRERPKPAKEDIRQAEETMPRHPSQASALKEYRAKRDFKKTREPALAGERSHKKPIFVIQKHDATRLHYDFRLEADGVLKSWAVTKEPSLDPKDKRLAVRVEDHPLSYATFAGTIPEGNYGAGEVEIWDHGTFENNEPDHTIAQGLDAGKLSVVLHGERLNGRFSLVRMRGKGKRENWLLIKGRDEYARGESAKANASVVHASRVQKAHARGTRAPRKSAPRVDEQPQELSITNPQKVLFPDDDITKLEVVEYYQAIAPHLLPFLKDRPMTLERLPDGLGEGKPHFWQKNTPASYPPWIPRIELEKERGDPVPYVLVNDLATLLYLVNQGTLTFHPWLSRVGRLDTPDFVLFDLDPGPASFSEVVMVALALRKELTHEDREAVVKTSGKTGLHVLVPWSGEGGFDEAREWAQQVAGRVMEALPDTATTEIRKAKRGDRIYIDVMQNARGHHAVPPYVVRAVPGAPVSTPLRWSELRADLDPKAFTIRTVPKRVARLKSDPMAPLLK